MAEIRGQVPNSAVSLSGPCLGPVAPIPVPIAIAQHIRTIKIVSWNITGMGVAKEISGSNLATRDLHQFLVQFDMVFLTETWLTPEDTPCIEGFELTTFCRPSREGRSRHGGILIAVKEGLCTHLQVMARHDDLFAIVQMTVDGTEMVAALVYNPPESSPYRCDSLFTELANALSFHGNGRPVILLGDFNARTRNEQSDRFDTRYPRTSCDATQNRDGQEFVELVSNLQLCILNGAVGDIAMSGKPTFQTAGGSSVVDYVAVSEDLVTTCSLLVHPMRVESHHLPLLAEFGLVTHRAIPADAGNPPGQKLGVTQRLVVTPQNIELLPRSLSSHEAQSIIDTFCANLASPDACVDAMAENFESMVYQLVAPVGRVSRARASQESFPSNEWYDEECKAAKRAAHDASRSGNWEAYLELKQEYNRIIQRKKREHQNEASDNLQNMFTSDKAEMWKTLSRFSKQHKKCPIELDEFLADMEGQNATPPEVMDDMDEFVKQYVEVPKCDEAILNVLDSPVQQEEITQACAELKKGKSCGADGIPISVIQCFASITSVLTLMFNVILARGEYPARWIEGMITPILKPGKDAKQPSSYSKVTVIPHIGKLFEKVIENRLAKFEAMMGSDDMREVFE
jgi:hypothetical protein